MRVLIADRNARLLESISRTFAHEFGIQTATSQQRCHELLSQGEFDLALISEKLADGPGLQLLGQIARDSPDTLRVFVARRARLELLRGKLGPFGLFRTLGYPIQPPELLSVLTLARAGLEVAGRRPAEAATGVAPREVAPREVRGAGEAPAALGMRRGAEASAGTGVRGAVGAGAGVERRGVEPRANVEANGKAREADGTRRGVNASAGAGVREAVRAPVGAEGRRAVEGQATVPAPAAVEQISLTSADAVFVGDVPKIFASIGKGRRREKSVRARARDNGTAPSGAAASEARSVRADVPSDTRQGPSGARQRPSEGRRGPAGAREVSSAAPQASSGSRQAPSDGRQGPAGAGKGSSAVPQAPGGQRPADNAVHPVSSGARQAPSDGRQGPAGAGKVSNAVPQAPSGQRHADNSVHPVSSGARQVQGQNAASALPSIFPTRNEAREQAARAVPPQARARRRGAANKGGGARGGSRSVRAGVEQKPPMRTKVALGATIAAVLVVTALSLKLGDTSAHVTRPVVARAEVEQPEVAAPGPSSAPVDSTQPFGPTPSVARHVEPKTDAVKSDVEPAGPQIAASGTPPVADPSTFGSEAYEAIYSN